MTVKEFYVSLGTWSDWKLREKIEKAVFSFKISWKDTLTDEVCQAIADNS